MKHTYQKNQDHGALVDVVGVNTSSLSKPASSEHHIEEKKASENLQRRFREEKDVTMEQILQSDYFKEKISLKPLEIAFIKRDKTVGPKCRPF